MIWGKRIASILLFLLFWELVALSGHVPTEYFPTVPTIAHALGGEIVAPEFSAALAATWAHTLYGLLISVALGLVLALLAARYAIVERALAPLVEMMRGLPPPALVPLSIFVFGLGTGLYLFIIVFAAVWPVYINAANALAQPEPVQTLTGRAFGYSAWGILLRLGLPAAMPEIFTGIRLAAGVALLADVAAEMLAGNGGLGHLLYDAAFTLRTADMFALMLVVGLSGVVLNLLVAAARRLLVGWHMQLALMGEPS